MVAPLLHRILNAPGDVQHAQRLAFPDPMNEGDLSSRDQRFEDFFNEKGIAFGQGVDGIQPLRLCVLL